MVAIVSGSGLGLFNSSTSTLGGNGANGNAPAGRGRDRVYVNTTTGNLIIQSVDDTLAALGLDFAAVRTYNSQGLADEDNNDLWRLGVHQKVVLTSGTVNTAGSVVTKTFGDGAEVKYTWNVARTRYESTDGDGADDFLAWDGTNSRWTWTDGSSRATEEYWLIGTVQRIKFSRDADSNTVTYNYTGSLLTSIAMAGTTVQTVVFSYTGNNLMSVRVDSFNAAGTVAQSQTLTRYAYDASNRLQTVTLDLSPDDNSVADANTYTTSYTYDGTSKRVASITQKDGSSVAFTYQNVNGDFRLKTATDAEGRLTTFSYSEVATFGGTQQTANANTGVLSTTETSNTPLTLNTGLLTTPWGTAALRDDVATGSVATAPKIGFDSNGNGVAVWVVTTGSSSVLKESRYTKSTNSWSTASALVTISASSITFGFAVGANGTAVAAWYNGSGNIVARRLSGTTWAAAATVGASSTGTPTISVAVRGSNQAVMWGEGSTTARNAWVSRWSGSAWAARFNVDTTSTATSQFAVTVRGISASGPA